MKTNNSASIIEGMLITHTVFAEARQRIEQCHAFSMAKTEAEGLAVVGESDTGNQRSEELPIESHADARANGMAVPILDLGPSHADSQESSWCHAG